MQRLDGLRTPALQEARMRMGFLSTVLGIQVKVDTKDNLTFLARAIQVACAWGTHLRAGWGLRSCLAAIEGATVAPGDAPSQSRAGPTRALLEAAAGPCHSFLAQRAPHHLNSVLSRPLGAPYIPDYMLIINTSNLKQASQTPQRTSGPGWSLASPQGRPQIFCIPLPPTQS